MKPDAGDASSQDKLEALKKDSIHRLFLCPIGNRVDVAYSHGYKKGVWGEGENPSDSIEQANLAYFKMGYADGLGDRARVLEKP